jgi:hypothetical protein
MNKEDMPMLILEKHPTLISSKGCFYGKAITAYSHSFQPRTGNDRSVCGDRTSLLCKKTSLLTQGSRKLV